LLRKTVSGIMLTLALISMLTLAFNIQRVKANGGLPPITIKADGSIYPPTAPIQRDGDMYTFTGNIDGFAIKVQKSNIVIDGAGYTLQGPGFGGGIDLFGVNDVIVKNAYIHGFDYGIYLGSASNNIILGNVFDNNRYGIVLYSSYNRIYHNDFIGSAVQQAWSATGVVNFWDDGYPSGGNYWSDYTDVDLNNDGIWDHPYVIDENNQDHYPLVNPWSPPTLKITSIDPSRPIAFAYQYLTILGEGFVPDSEVTLHDGYKEYPPIPKERTRFVSPNRIEVVVGLGYEEGDWQVWVTNPDSSQSNKKDFQTRKALDEEIMKVLGLALQYWTEKDAVIMTAIAGGESGWSPSSVGDLVKDWGIIWNKKKDLDPNINSMGACSWGLLQILMPAHLDKLKDLAHTDDYAEIAKWLRDPNNNVKAAYEVWKKQGFGAWSAFTQPMRDGKPNPSYYKNPEIWDRVTNIAKRMSIYKCPVNITITDNYGRIISEIENHIPGASFEYFNTTDTKIFYLSLNLTYHVQINATAYGNITIVQITPTESIYETAFSQVTFNLTSETVAEFDLLPHDANYTLKVDENGDGIIDYELTPEVETLTTEYDIGITEIVPTKTVVGQSYSLPINITIMNYGAHTERFNITVCANTTSIATQTLSLTSENSATITFTWNTSGFARGNYTISAHATTVINETYIADNSLSADQCVCISIPGDLDCDRDVDLYDAVKLLARYGAKEGNPEYDCICDIDDDGDIDLYDAVKLLTNYGKKCP